MFVIMLHCIFRNRKRESFCQIVPLECTPRVWKGPRDWLWHRAPRLVNPALRTVVLKAYFWRPQTWTWENSSDPSQMLYKWKKWMSSELYDFCRNRDEHVMFGRYCSRPLRGFRNFFENFSNLSNNIFSWRIWFNEQRTNKFYQFVFLHDSHLLFLQMIV